MLTLWRNLGDDLRYGLRLWLRKPGFTAVAVLTLALGIGANTAVFSVAYATLLAPLPYARADELVLLWSSFQKMGASRAPASAVEMREIRRQSRTLADLAGIWVGNGTLTGEQEPEQIKLGSVTHNFFEVLGARPLIGRAFTPADENAQDGGRPLILSYALWQRRYGGDTGVVGRQVRLGGGSATVVGVMPREFQLHFAPDANVPPETQAWVPFSAGIYQGPVDLYYLRLVGRLKPGVSREQAQQDADAVAARLRETYAEFAGESLKLEVVPLSRDAVRDIRPALVALLAGAGLVMMIACVNVAGLLLARASTRRQEFAVRAALGASPGRVVRQLLAEGLLLCAGGGLAGLAVGQMGVDLLPRLRPDALARLDAVELNWPVLGFTAALSLLAGLLSALAPALTARRVNLVATLQEAGRGVSHGRRRARALLVAGEVALSFVLLVGAGLLLGTLARLQEVAPGFKPDGVFTFEISLGGAKYANAGQRAAFVTRWEEELAALPGVEAAGAVSHLPLDNYPNWYSPYAPEGLSENQKQSLLADYRCVTPGYFQAMGAELLGGRWFDQLDTAEGRQVVIVDDLLARQTWPNESAVGRRLQVEQFTDRGFVPQWAEVVGVVRHLRHHSLGRELRGQIYLPYPQSAREHLSYAVKAQGDPLALAATLRRELRALDPDMAVNKMLPLSHYVSRSLASARFTALLAGLFAALALVLAAVGVYGLVSYSVAERTREIGVRMALGAGRRRILRLVLSQGMRPALVGIALGLVVAPALTRLIAGLLYGVTATDRLTFAVIAALLLAVAWLACWVPARRATKVDPLIALRSE
jgi:predicted permease